MAVWITHREHDDKPCRKNLVRLTHGVKRDGLGALTDRQGGALNKFGVPMRQREGHRRKLNACRKLPLTLEHAAYVPLLDAARALNVEALRL